MIFTNFKAHSLALQSHIPSKPSAVMHHVKSHSTPVYLQDDLYGHNGVGQIEMIHGMRTMMLST